MIVDCGSHEFSKTLNTPTDVKVTSSENPGEHITPRSIKKAKLTIQSSAVYGTKVNRGKTLNAIRQSLGATLGDQTNILPSISVKTVVISHPDSDHFNWIWHVLDASKDKLENIILGGRPEKYLDNENFRIWLEKWLNKNSKVFFLAAEDSKVKNVDDLQRFKQKGYKLAPSLFSNPQLPHFNIVSTRVFRQDSLVKPTDDLYKAFDFGPHTLFEFLTINPVHIASNVTAGHYIRFFYGEDESSDIDNQDSLVLKINNQKTRKSAVLLGDATALTMTRAFSNYNPGELKTDVLLAAHHGASSWGSNNSQLFEMFKPTCVVFSNGQHLKFAHPREKAYNQAKQGIPVGQTEPHNMTRYHETGGDNQKGEYQTWMVTRPIFSTFDNGSIQATFADEKGEISLKSIDGGDTRLYSINSTTLAQEDTLKASYPNLNPDMPIFASPGKGVSELKL